MFGMGRKGECGECGACEAPLSAHTNVGGFLLCPPSLDTLSAAWETRPVPQEYDGFVTPVGDEMFEVAAGGAVVAVVEGESAARAVLAEHCVDRPMWLVGVDGSAIAL